MCPKIDPAKREPDWIWDWEGNQYDPDDDSFPGPMVLTIIAALLVILIIWACLTIPAA